MTRARSFPRRHRNGAVRPHRLHEPHYLLLLDNWSQRPPRRHWLREPWTTALCSFLIVAGALLILAALGMWRSIP